MIFLFNNDFQWLNLICNFALNSVLIFQLKSFSTTLVQIYVLKSVKWKSQKKRKKFPSPNSVMKYSPINHHQIQWWNTHWKMCFFRHLNYGQWIRWKNQFWICHRIQCITKFFTEFGAEKCTFSFTGGYSAHTSLILTMIALTSQGRVTVAEAWFWGLQMVLIHYLALSASAKAAGIHVIQGSTPGKASFQENLSNIFYF